METLSESDEDIEFILNLKVIAKRKFVERKNFLIELNEEEFLRRFRISKNSFNLLLDKLRVKIAPKTNRSHGISAETKLFAALRFYATGSFYTVIGDFAGLSTASLSRIVQQVSEAIASMRDEYIYMPRDHDELSKNFAGFYEIGQLPNVIGTIDCTHIKILGQGGDDGEIFRNRKQFFSINVQSVANFDLSFQDIVARWPGSTHDAHIFSQTRLKQRFETNEFKNGLLLGDGGYKLETYLMTPFRKPQDNPQKSYNKVQIRVRNTVERKYGVWKGRFPCLAFGLRCKLDTALTVIVACAVLHNFCIQQKDPEPQPDEEILRAIEESTLEAEVINQQVATITASHRRAVLKREEIAKSIYETMQRV